MNVCFLSCWWVDCFNGDVGGFGRLFMGLMVGLLRFVVVYSVKFVGYLLFQH